ncbi:MAG: hypothetical protein ACK4XK_07135, partial [Casimicrobiaceae bacterium]
MFAAQIDVKRLERATQDQPLIVETDDGSRYRFRLERLERPRAGGLVWIGRLAVDAIDEAEAAPGAMTASLSVMEGRVVGTIELPETRLEIWPDGSAIEGAVLILDQGRTGLSRALYARSDALPPPPFELRPFWMQEEGRAVRERLLDLGIEQLKSLPAPQSTIDVMVAYTAGMITRYGSHAGVVSRLNQLIALTNQAYQTSEVAITLQLAHAFQVAYPDNGDVEQALYDLTGHNGSTTITPPASL